MALTATPMASIQSMKRTNNIATYQEVPDVNLVRLGKYCELTGDTADAVHARRKKGQWADGIHCAIGPDNRLWVDLKETQKWVRGQC